MFRPSALAAVEAHRAAGGHLILLSASPDLYVPRIGQLLGFERTLCTEVQWRHVAAEEDRLDGALRTPNRRGEEKSRCLAWLRTEYPNLPVVAYGNSQSDIPHLREADRAVLVNGSTGRDSGGGLDLGAQPRSHGCNNPSTRPVYSSEPVILRNQHAETFPRTCQDRPLGHHAL
jgi:hypothetical protein